LTLVARDPTVPINQQLDITLNLNLRVRVVRLETADVPRPMLLGEYFGELQLKRFSGKRLYGRPG